jgi:hypothetical protein
MRAAEWGELVRGEGRVDNDNHFASFFAKKGLQTVIVFARKNYVIIAIIVISRNIEFKRLSR